MTSGVCGLFVQMSRKLYTQSHEWLQYNGVEIKIGITDHGQQSLGEIVFVDLPKVGTAVEKNQILCVVESVKVASEILAPISGIIQRVNQNLVEHPNLINESAEENGWICVLTSDNGLEVNGGEFLDVDRYKALVG